jgi:carboxyl-terminal processing protease
LGNGASGAEPKAPPKPIEFGSPEDFQLQQAINHLKGRPVQVSNTEAPAAPAVKP